MDIFKQPNFLLYFSIVLTATSVLKKNLVVFSEVSVGIMIYVEPDEVQISYIPPSLQKICVCAVCHTLCAVTYRIYKRENKLDTVLYVRSS